MLTLLVAVALAAPSDQVTRLAAPGLSAIHLDEKVATFYTEHLAHQLGHAGVQVLTPAEIGAVIGLERQRQLIGCTDSNCISELSAATGVDGVVSGSLGRFGESMQVNVKVLSAHDASTLASFTGRVQGDEATLDLLTTAGRMLAAGVLEKLNRKPVAVRAAEGSAKRWPWAVSLSGATVTAGGGVLLYLARSHHERLVLDARADPPQLSPQEVTTLSSAGALYQTAGWLLVGAGAATLASSVVLYQLSGATPVQTAVAVGPGGGGILVGGRF